VPHARVDRATARIPRGEVRYAERDLCAIVRRAEFDALLARHAAARGVAIREGEKVVAIHREPAGWRVVTDRAEIHPRVIVGADGSGSIVRRALFSTAKRAIGRAVMCDVPAADVAEFDARRYVFDFRAVPRGLKGYVWEFPCWIGGEQYLNVGAYALDRGAGVSLTGLAAERARELGVSAPRLEAFPIHWYAADEPVATEGALLIGDAAGCDPLMGEGISYAFEFARLAAVHIAAAFGGADFEFARYSQAVASAWFGRKLRRLATAARLFYGPASSVAFALAKRSHRLQRAGIRWYNGVGDWDRISGWRALARVLAGSL
jgi:menaquinone-9 beta-reductase